MTAAVARAGRVVVHNWPLKIAAVGFATVLYAGLVLSQSARTFPGSVPIQTQNQSSDMFVLSDLGVVTGIRYVVPGDLGLRVEASSFSATVDLSGVQPSGKPVSLTVHVAANDPRVQVLDFSPRRITATIDLVTTRTVPIKAVVLGVPNGFELGDPEYAQTTAQVTGPETIVDRAVEADARVTIDPSGIDVNRNITLVAVDGSGNQLDSVDISPSSVQVKLAVFTDRRTRTVPVNPVVTGTPAAGFEVASVTVDPVAISVQGDANDLSGLDRADSQPVSITGASSDVVETVQLNLPNGVQALGEGTVTVTVRLRPVTSTRTFEAGLVLVGASSERTYALSVDQVLVTIGGSTADLDRLSGAALVLTVDVSGLGDGNHKVTPDANLTTGLSLISVSPSPVTVTVASPPPSPAPSASP